MFGLGDVGGIAIAVFIGFAIVFVTIALATAGGGAGSKFDRRLRRIGAKTGKGDPTPEMMSAELRRNAGGNAGVDRLLNHVLPNRKALELKLAKTGYKIPIWSYVAASVAVGIVAAVAARFMVDLPAIGAIGIGIGLGYLLPRFVIGWLGRRRLKRFLTLLPDALDLMVRTVKSGLPIAEAIDLAAQDMDDPIRSEFRMVSDQMKIGRQLEEALWETAERLDLPEFNFFVVSLSVQRETGGNIGETLSNLSTLLRRRQQMKLKIKALSAEARASAWIVGSLPFIMCGVLFLVNERYISQLFTDPRGHFLVGIGLGAELIGVLWMIKMSKFEI